MLSCNPETASSPQGRILIFNRGKKAQDRILPIHLSAQLAFSSLWFMTSMGSRMFFCHGVLHYFLQLASYKHKNTGALPILAFCVLHMEPTVYI